MNIVTCTTTVFCVSITGDENSDTNVRIDRKQSCYRYRYISFTEFLLLLQSCMYITMPYNGKPFLVLVFLVIIKYEYNKFSPIHHFFHMMLFVPSIK